MDAKRIAEIRELAQDVCDAVSGGALVQHIVRLDDELAKAC